MTFLSLYTRFLDLIGESSTTAITAIHKRHINAAVKDIVNARPFSWNVATTDLTLASGTANLPTDFNPMWGLDDARIVGSSTSDDDIFTQIDIRARDAFGASDYVYWITRNATTGVHVFNTPVQTGTVTIYYHYTPTDMSTDADVCPVPDGEAVAYLAASKNWVGDERNIVLKQEYEKEASARIRQMYSQDLNFGPKYLERSMVIDNPIIASGAEDDDWHIAED